MHRRTVDTAPPASGRAAALLAVAVAGLLFAAAGAAGAGSVSGLGVVPNPFSPNGDGAYDRTAVRFTLTVYSDLEVSIVDSVETVVAELWADWADTGAYELWWDGTTGSLRDTVPDGEYHVIVRAHPVGEPWEETSAPLVVDTHPITITSLSVLPNLMTPDGDGVADSTSITLHLANAVPTGNAVVDILDVEDELVTELYAGTSVESLVLWWSGLDQGGSASPDASYQVRVRTLDPAGNEDERTVLFDLDRDPPSVGIVYPEGLTEFRVDDTEALLEGWAYDRSGVSSIEISIDEGDWIDVAFSGEDTVWWSYALSCTACVEDSLEESHTIYYRAHDGVITADGEGHYNGDGVPVPSFDLVYDVAPPAHVASAVDDDDNVYYPGEIITIVTEWDDEGYEVTADFSAVDSDYDDEDVEVSGGTGGVWTVTYPVSAQAAAPVSGAAVTISAVDVFDRTGTDDSVTVSLAVSTGGPVGLSLDRDWFDPTEGEALEISLGSYDGPVSIEVFSLGGALVRALESEGVDSMTWDGRNDGGEYVASGVFFVRIETDDGDAVHKVAVVK